MSNELDDKTAQIEDEYILVGLRELFENVADQDKDAGDRFDLCLKAAGIHNDPLAGQMLALGYKIVYGCETYLEVLNKHLQHFIAFAHAEFKLSIDPDNIKILVANVITKLDTREFERAFKNLRQVFIKYYAPEIEEKVLKFRDGLADNYNIVQFRR